MEDRSSSKIMPVSDSSAVNLLGAHQPASRVMVLPPPDAAQPMVPPRDLPISPGNPAFRPRSPVPHDDPIQLPDSGPKFRPSSQTMGKRNSGLEAEDLFGKSAETAGKPEVALQCKPCGDTSAIDQATGRSLTAGLLPAVAQQGLLVTPKLIMILLAANLLLMVGVGCFSVYQYVEVQNLSSVTQDIKEEGEATSQGLEALKVDVNQNLASVSEDFSTGFTSLNETYAAQLDSILSLCTGIKALLVTSENTLQQIYLKLSNEDSLVDLVNTKAAEILAKIATMQTSMDNTFSSSSPTLTLLQSIYNQVNTLSTDVTTMSTTVNTMSSTLPAEVQAIDTNTIAMQTSIDSTLFISSATTLICTQGVKQIAVVSLTGHVTLGSLINTVVIPTSIATVTQYDYAATSSAWIYDLPKFDVLLFDFAQDYAATAAFSATVQKYVLAFMKRGGSVMVTHNVIDSSVAWMDASMYSYCGITRVTTAETATVTTVTKNTAKTCHPIFSKATDLTGQSTFTVASTHSSYASATTGVGSLLLSYGSSKPYLVATETTSSSSVVTRCVYTAAGYSTPASSGDEKNVLNNAIYWLLKSS